MDLKKLFCGEANTIEYKGMIDAAGVSDLGIVQTGYVAVASARDSGLWVEISIESVIKTSCALCLESLAFTIEAAESYRLTDDLSRTEDDDYAVAPDCVLDTDRLAYELAVLSVPQRFVCSEACRGLCQKCGKNLNTGDCACEKREIDPRLAKLADYFKD